MLLSEDFIIIAIYLGICQTLGKDYKHPQAKLYLSEILLCGMLFALKGISFRRFHIFLKRKRLFNLPEKSRLQRLLITHKKTCRAFLGKPTFFNVMDSFGVEIIHPLREGRSLQSQKVSGKGRSNLRWIVGRKVNVAINGELKIVKYQDRKANVADLHFNSQFSKLKGLLLTDNGYRISPRTKKLTPSNFKICPKGQWNERMWIERIYSLWVRICNMKKSFHRTIKGFKAKISYLMALTNMIFSLNDQYGFKKCSMIQWAL